MYSTAVQKAFGESDSELCDYIIITADQGNSGVKVKMPWLYLMHQDKSDSKVETLKCLKHPKPHGLKPFFYKLARYLSLSGATHRPN